ncbi:MAG TPA: hypothetical protein VGB44_04790 [Flavobacterium sp.]
MKTTFLFPRQFRIIGWIMFVPALIGAIILLASGYDEDRWMLKVPAIFNLDILGDPESMVLVSNGVSDEILLVMIIVGGLFAGFSKLKNEDELIAKIRYESLVWAVYVNFAVMIFATIFVYGLYYLNVMMANMCTVLFFFIIRFHLKLYMFNRSVTDEE